MSFKCFLLFLILLTTSACQKPFNNRVDELLLRCGGGTEQGKEYILVDNVENGMQLDVFNSEGTSLPTTQKGCVERPKSGEVFLSNKDRRLGLWINGDTKDTISLKPFHNKVLPTTCNSVIHGDGLGFSLRFSTETNDLSNRFKYATVQILNSDKSESIHSWAPRPIATTLDFQFDQGKVIASGEYLLSVDLKDDITNVSSRSECILRIDYSNLRISPADTIKNVREYNNQEVLVVEPGYEIGFYVSEGFRDVSIEYCLKKVNLEDISSNLSPAFTRCEKSEDFLNSTPEKMNEGFWFISFKGRRGKVEGDWQHAFFLVDKVCNGRFESIKSIADEGCTVIKGDVYLNITTDKDATDYDLLHHRKMDWIASIQGDLVIKITEWTDDSNQNYLTIFNNLNEISGNFLFYSSGTTQLQGFDRLRDISGDFTVSALTQLDLIKGFRRLETVGGRLDLSSLERLKHIEGLSSLKKVYHLILTNALLESLHFPALEELNRLELRNLPLLKKLTGFDKLKDIKEIHLYNLPQIKSLSDFRVENRIELLELNSLQNLETLAGYRGGEIRTLSLIGMNSLVAGFDEDSGVVLTEEFRLSSSASLNSLTQFPFGRRMKRVGIISDSLTSLAGLQKISSLENLDLQLGSDAQSLYKDLNINNFSDLNRLALASETPCQLKINTSTRQPLVESIILRGFSNVEIETFEPMNPKLVTIENSPLTDLNFLVALGAIGELWFSSFSTEDFSSLSEILTIDTLKLSMKRSAKQVKGLSNLKLRSLILKSSDFIEINADLSELEKFEGLEESLVIGDGICVQPEALNGLSERIKTPLLTAPASYQSSIYPGVFASSTSSCSPSYFK